MELDKIDLDKYKNLLNEYYTYELDKRKQEFEGKRDFCLKRNIPIDVELLKREFEFMPDTFEVFMPDLEGWKSIKEHEEIYFNAMNEVDTGLKYSALSENDFLTQYIDSFSNKWALEFGEYYIEPLLIPLSAEMNYTTVLHGFSRDLAKIRLYKYAIERKKVSYSSIIEKNESKKSIKLTEFEDIFTSNERKDIAIKVLIDYSIIDSDLNYLLGTNRAEITSFIIVSMELDVIFKDEPREPMYKILTRKFGIETSRTSGKGKRIHKSKIEGLYGKYGIVKAQS